MLTNDEGLAAIDEINSLRTMEIREAFRNYDLVDAVYDPVNGSYVVMSDKRQVLRDEITTSFEFADRDPKIDTGMAIAEMGYTSPSPFTSWTRNENVPQLRDRQGIRTYYDMKRADGTVRGSLRLLKTPILSAHWFVEPKAKNIGDEPTQVDINIAKFVEQNLFYNLNVAWSEIVEQALQMCEYGYMPMEKVFEIKEDKVWLKKLAPRHPLDIQEWVYDVNGGPNGIIMEPTEATGWKEIAIPIEKLVVFVLEKEAGDMRGVSVLRSAYKHYYYKDTLYKIDAIQKERHGIGVPIIKLPLGYTAQDRKLADDLGKNLRTNEKAHITVPMNWEVLFAKLEGQPVDCIKSIEHHDERIMINIIATFMQDPTAKPDSMDMFLKSTRYIANTVADTINKYVIPQLVDLNFQRGGYPCLHARRIGEWEDMRTMSFTLRNLVGASLVTPDDRLEKQIREEIDMPPMDKATQRMVGTPQAPGAPKPSPTGPPRQAANSSPKTPRPNYGIDSSGG